MGHTGSTRRKSVQQHSSSYSTDNDDDDMDGADVKRRDSKKNSKKGKEGMSFFRRQSDEARRRFEHQQYLAQECPDPIYDISSCQLSEVPPGIYSFCKVLQKEVLLMHDNWLSSINHGGAISDLRTLRVLDLHNNEIKFLPSEIGCLDYLQVLNVEENRIKKIPESIGDMKNLQTLNFKNNRLKVLPDAICQLPCLRLLDISGNEVVHLPQNLCNDRTLENLNVDTENMVYPSSDICKEGTESIMKFLCSESGLEYLPPSNFLLNVLEPPHPISPTMKNASFKAFEEDESKLQSSIEQYNAMMDKKKEEQAALERQIIAQQNEMGLLAAEQQKNKDYFLKVVAEDFDKMQHDLDELRNQQDRDRAKFVSLLQQVEKGAEDLIKTLLDVNEKARKNEELLEQMEKERIVTDELFSVRWEELQNLRRQEVLHAMEDILHSTEHFEQVRQDHELNKEQAMKGVLESEAMTSAHQVESLLYYNEVDRNTKLKVLEAQELLQKQAFEALQLQKDIKHARLTNQIELIEAELASLTTVEVEKKDMRMETEMNILAHKRVALTQMLIQLMEERESRQRELQKRMGEMEQQKLDGQMDYWLVQYQRLMDKKPQALIDQEKKLDVFVLEILEKSGGTLYTAQFARHRVSIETLIQMSEDDLKSVGVDDSRIRRNIIRSCEEFRAGQKLNHIEYKKQEMVSIPEPTAPPPDQSLPSKEERLFQRQMSRQSSRPTLQRENSVAVSRTISSECCICLDKQAEVIFLNCGHVCCCYPCSEPLQDCPLCRGVIEKRIKLYMLTESL